MAPEQGIGFTRIRDLMAVLIVATIGAYALVAWNYGRLPALPRLAGFAAALVGVAEALVGLGLRARITAPPDAQGRPSRPPVPPLVAARAVMAAKATSLAGAALAGLWLGLTLYVVPRASQLLAARADLPTALIGLGGAVVMAGGALFLEFCCRTPTSSTGTGQPGQTGHN